MFFGRPKVLFLTLFEIVSALETAKKVQIFRYALRAPIVKISRVSLNCSVRFWNVLGCLLIFLWDSQIFLGCLAVRGGGVLNSNTVVLVLDFWLWFSAWLYESLWSSFYWWRWYRTFVGDRPNGVIVSFCWFPIRTVTSSDLWFTVVTIKWIWNWVDFYIVSHIG